MILTVQATYLISNIQRNKTIAVRMKRAICKSNIMSISDLLKAPLEV